MAEDSPYSSGLDSTPNSSDVDSDESCERCEGEQDGVRQQLRASTRKRYLSGESRKAYKVRKNLESLETSPMLPGVCFRCTSYCVLLAKHCHLEIHKLTRNP